ncbi:MAG: DUF896 domain-containing protein [Bacillaceae bacterium]|nr:DUF896 domain-containing protein [Bacillaceae bacterium]
MTQDKIDRINELARKQKREGLSSEEKKEQKKLREEYVKAFRTSLKAQLDNITVVDQEGYPVNPRTGKRLQ